MLESIPEVGPFLAGAVVGMGQGLGHKVMELLIKYLGLPRSAANKPGEAPTESTAGGGRERTAEQIQHAPSDEEELAHVVGSLHNEVDWKNMVNGLKQSGMPFDASAAQQLAALGDEVLKKTILPPHA